MKRQMICISGNIAVGKTEVAQILAETLNYELYKASESFRKLARDNNMSLVEFNNYVKNNPDIDRGIENTTKEVIASKNKIVVDARLGFFLAPNAFRVYLTANEDIAAKRLYLASKTRGKEESYESVFEAKNAIEIREASEQERYLTLYNVDIHDETNYDFVIDTTDLSSREVAEKIIKAYNVWSAVEFE